MQTSEQTTLRVRTPEAAAALTVVGAMFVRVEKHPRTGGAVYHFTGANADEMKRQFNRTLDSMRHAARSVGVSL
jgi:CYTH domain-containing protein